MFTFKMIWYASHSDINLLGRYFVYVLRKMSWRGLKQLLEWRPLVPWRNRTSQSIKCQWRYPYSYGSLHQGRVLKLMEVLRKTKLPCCSRLAYLASCKIWWRQPPWCLALCFAVGPSSRSNMTRFQTARCKTRRCPWHTVASLLGLLMNLAFFILNNL